MTDGGTVSKAAIAIAEVNADAAGNDNDNLNDEYVVLENTEDTAVDMSGWTLTDTAAHTYTFPTGFTLPAGEEVTVHTGSGTDTNTDLYWGKESAIWNNNRDTVILRTADGTLILKEEY